MKIKDMKVGEIGFVTPSTFACGWEGLPPFYLRADPDKPYSQEAGGAFCVKIQREEGETITLLSDPKNFSCTDRGPCVGWFYVKGPTS